MAGRIRNGLAGILVAGALALPGCRTSGESTDLGVGSMAVGVLAGSPAAFLFGAGATVYGAGQAAGGNGSSPQYRSNFFNSDWRLQSLRSSFSRGEHIAFVADVPHRKNKWVTLRIFNAPNNMLRRDNISVGDAGDLGVRKVVIYQPNTFSPGTYTGVWHDCFDDYLGQSTIVVNE